MDNKILFRAGKYYFSINVPDYETPVFGYKVGELRNENFREGEKFEIVSLKALQQFLKESDIQICTFRGN